MLIPFKQAERHLEGKFNERMENSPSVPPYDWLLLCRCDCVEITVHAVHRLLLLLGVHALCEVVGGAIVVPSEVKQDLRGG